MDYISIDNFEGPLDLLLHLVKESNIDIFDIKVEEITDKYLDYINHEENLNINISSSYLVMAAELMYLKSKLLLPSNKKEEDNSEEDEEITRENLINKLLEYKKYKEMTPVFKELEEERKKIYIKAPEKVSNYTESVLSGEDTIDNLLEAFKKFLERKELDKPLETTVTKREYSVRERKNNIKKILMTKKKAYLDDLFEDENNAPQPEKKNEELKPQNLDLNSFEDEAPVLPQESEDDDTYDLQKELEAKFDELFGPIDEE